MKRRGEIFGERKIFIIILKHATPSVKHDGGSDVEWSHTTWLSEELYSLYFLII